MSSHTFGVFHSNFHLSCIWAHFHIPHNRPTGSGYHSRNCSAGDMHLCIYRSESFPDMMVWGGGSYAEQMQSSLNRFAISLFKRKKKVNFKKL